MSASVEPIYDPFSSATTEDPYPAYRRLLADEPAYYNAERDFWALSRFEDVQAAVNDWKRFSSAEGVRIDDLLALAGPSPLTMDPPRHGLLRNLVRKSFSVREMKALEPMVARNAADLLQSIEGREVFDAADEFAKILPVAVICEILGVPSQDARMLKTWAESMLESVPDEPGSTEAALTAAAATRDYWTLALEERRRQPREDVLTTVATAQVDGYPLPFDEQIGMCNLIFEAGNATTGTLIGNALHALAMQPAQRVWLQGNPDRLADAVEEFLRWESPVQALMRVVKEDIAIHGHTIPLGSRVMLVLGAANRDPRVWDDPDTLDLGRAPVKNLAFGEGIHHCLGAPLSRLEAPIAVSLFLAQYPNYSVESFKRFHDVSLRSLKSLVIRTDAA